MIGACSLSVGWDIKERQNWSQIYRLIVKVKDGKVKGGAQRGKGTWWRLHSEPALTQIPEPRPSDPRPGLFAGCSYITGQIWRSEVRSLLNSIFPQLWCCQQFAGGTILSNLSLMRCLGTSSYQKACHWWWPGNWVVGEWEMASSLFPQPPLNPLTTLPASSIAAIVHFLYHPPVKWKSLSCVRLFMTPGL